MPWKFSGAQIFGLMENSLLNERRNVIWEVTPGPYLSPPKLTAFTTLFYDKAGKTQIFNVFSALS